MARLPLIDPDSAEGPVKDLMDQAKKKMGKVPNILRGMGNSPAALEAYMALSAALAKSTLPARTRELIALAIGNRNHCGYCVSAHTAIATNLGASAEAARQARDGKADDPKDQAAITLALRVMETTGFVEDRELEDARAAGLTDGEIADITAAVALNIYTNLINHVVDTPIDFPEAPDLEQVTRH